MCVSDTVVYHDRTHSKERAAKKKKEKKRTRMISEAAQNKIHSELILKMCDPDRVNEWYPSRHPSLKAAHTFLKDSIGNVDFIETFSSMPRPSPAMLKVCKIVDLVFKLPPRPSGPGRGARHRLWERCRCVCVCVCVCARARVCYKDRFFLDEVHK